MSNVYRDGKVHVRATSCENCLLSKDRLVSGARARELVQLTRSQEASTFVCHKSQVSSEPESICAAWFERYAPEDTTLRLAVAFGIVERVEGEREPGPRSNT